MEEANLFVLFFTNEVLPVFQSSVISSSAPLPPFLPCCCCSGRNRNSCSFCRLDEQHLCLCASCASSAFLLATRRKEEPFCDVITAGPRVHTFESSSQNKKKCCIFTNIQKTLLTYIKMPLCILYTLYLS